MDPKLKARIDAIAAKAMAEMKFDAAEANVFARELLRVRSQVFETEIAELKATQFMPRNTEVGTTDESYTYRVADNYGTTRTGASYATNAPRADVSMREETPQLIRPITASYGWSFQEARVAARTGNQLSMRKAKAAREAIAIETNRVLTFGDTTHYGAALAGLANLSGVNSYTVPNGSSGSPLWANKTPDEILKDMHGMASKIVTDTKDLKHPDMMVLPLASHELVATTRMGDGSDKTILRFFLETSPHVKRVESWSSLDAAPNSEWTGKRALCYVNRPDVLDYLLPIEFEQLSPDITALETVTTCHARIGGVMAYHPKAILYADGI
jgi:hypothetical protein